MTDQQQSDETTDADTNPGGNRSIELEIEVPGTPEEVWRAIATGPGISSWYVPHEVEERAGGAATASFGPEPEMQIAGRVAAWEPPRRIVFDGKVDDNIDGESDGEADADVPDAGLAFEWLVEAKDGGTCIVRLVNSGFGAGSEHDEWYDAMTEGWKLFLYNLKLHLEHFSGRTATAMLPMATWADSTTNAWETLTGALGIPAEPTVGQRLEVGAEGTPPLAGTVTRVTPTYLALLVDEPAPGTAFLAAEHQGDQAQVSIWAYLYGPEGAAAVERDEPRWRDWLSRRAVG
ncbi:MAG: SRPBCC domain-containing protein [Acidimicrobiia bacterium]|nr:SRPBCC domain-containing protein [Acidimicrobiia bacterium]MDH5519841.1 SRPBCC domain-containing protein [Acidimicrobiia bacterium]